MISTAARKKGPFTRSGRVVGTFIGISQPGICPPRIYLSTKEREIEGAQSNALV